MTIPSSGNWISYPFPEQVPRNFLVPGKDAQFPPAKYTISPFFSYLSRHGEREAHEGGTGHRRADPCHLQKYAEFHPGHMGKEEKGFFPESIGSFSKREQEELVKRFWEFDKGLLLVKYLKFMDQHERVG